MGALIVLWHWVVDNSRDDKRAYVGELNLRLKVLRFACDREESSAASSTAAGVGIGDGDGLKGFLALAPPPKTNQGWKTPDTIGSTYVGECQGTEGETKSHTQRTLRGGGGRRGGSLSTSRRRIPAVAAAVVRRHKEIKQGRRTGGDFSRRGSRRWRFCQRVRGGRGRSRRLVPLVSAISSRGQRGPGPQARLRGRLVTAGRT